MLDEAGDPIAGYTREEATPLSGNGLRLPVAWGACQDVGALAGRAIRLRFHLQDCKLYAFRFGA